MSDQEALRRFKAETFKALAHPTRIAVVELLRDQGEVGVMRIYEQLGVEQANASQHLALLRACNVVSARKEGNQVFYSLRDKRLGRILDLMRDYFHAHLSESLALLQSIESEKARK